MATRFVCSCNAYPWPHKPGSGPCQATEVYETRTKPREPRTRVPEKTYAEKKLQQSVDQRKHRWAVVILTQARHRARKFNRPFDITVEDIPTPDFCPVSRTQLNYYNTKAAWDSPAIDRKDPSLGYVKGNIWTIAQWVNASKGARSWAEFEANAMTILQEAITRQLASVTKQLTAEDELSLLREDFNLVFGETGGND